MRLATVPILALAVMAGTAAVAQEMHGDVAVGRRLAERWCASCHQLAGTVKEPAASFPQIARMPSTTALALRVFLRTSHPTMPNVTLTPADTDDLVAFILSLK
jgi:cytochrome c